MKRAELEEIYLGLLRHPHDSWRVQNQALYVYVREALAEQLAMSSEYVQNKYELIVAKQQAGEL